VRREIKKQNDLTDELKDRVGLWLQTAPRGSQKLISEMLKVTTRTLRSWKSKCHKPKKKRGRKRIGVTLTEMLTIAREWKRQGSPGSRPIIQALPKMRVKVIQNLISELKERKKKRYENKRMEVRTSVVVHQVSALGVMDAASMIRGEEFIVYRNRGSLQMMTEECAQGATQSSDTIGFLEGLKQKGQLPLVVGTDNGSPFCADSVETFLQDNKVVHLKSLPRVPQHNGSAENAVLELKALLLDGISAADACDILNKNRLREKLGWQTSDAVNQNKFKPVTEDERTIFYNSARTAIDLAMKDKKSACEKRKAEREAIFQTLESFSLITRTQGRSTHPFKAERIT